MNDRLAGLIPRRARSTVWAHGVLGVLLTALVLPAQAGEPRAGEHLYEHYCASCHGVNGRGNGPAAAALRPPPADMSDPAWQEAVSDAYLRDIIRDGGTGVGRSPQMPPWGHTLDEAELERLVRYIRSFPEAEE